MEVIDLSLDDPSNTSQKPGQSSHHASPSSSRLKRGRSKHAIEIAAATAAAAHSISPHPSTPNHELEAAALRAQISDCRALVEERRQLLTAATIRLESLESRYAHLERQVKAASDAAFDWLAPNPWDSVLSELLENTFRIQAFRPLQREALNATIRDRDVFAILPTGAGKSLIYQLAAVVDRGLTVVVTPLISLSQDQRAALKRLNIQAESLDSTTSKQDMQRIYKTVLPAGGKIPGSVQPRKGDSGLWLGYDESDGKWIRDDIDTVILFVTPEQVVKSKRLMNRLEVMHEAGHLSRIAIDEAHCCSQWGHDFRVEYRKLGLLRRQCPRTPILALSATANQETVKEVCEILETRDCVVFRGSVNRPNLYYEGRPKKENEDEVIKDIAGIAGKEFNGQCGIVYVFSRKETEVYAQRLRELGVNAAAYHGDLPGETRLGVHDLWSQGHVKVVVATIAFGMGIDNQNVRFVVHATMASSLEGYYQESGRAGRDGKPAKCIVLHRPKEFARLSSFVAEKGGNRLQKMYQMYQYASGRVGNEGMRYCRRAMIANAFDENTPQGSTYCCDLCTQRKMKRENRKTTDIVKMDVTELAKDALRIMTHIRKKKPDDKITLLAFAIDWSNRGTKGKVLRGDIEAIDKRIPVEVRMEIIIQLVLEEGLEEYHRFSSYSVNSYIKEGPKVIEMLSSNNWKCIVPMWRKGSEALTEFAKGKVFHERVDSSTNTKHEELEEDVIDEDLSKEEKPLTKNVKKRRRGRNREPRSRRRRRVADDVMIVEEEIIDEDVGLNDYISGQLQMDEESEEEMDAGNADATEDNDVEYSEEEELDGEGAAGEEEEIIEDEIMEQGHS